MTKYKVVMFHGHNGKLKKTLSEMCGEFDEENNCFWWSESIDEFLVRYGGNIQVYQGARIITVSQFDKFSQM